MAAATLVRAQASIEPLRRDIVRMNVLRSIVPEHPPIAATLSMLMEVQQNRTRAVALSAIATHLDNPLEARELIRYVEQREPDAFWGPLVGGSLLAQLPENAGLAFSSELSQPAIRDRCRLQTLRPSSRGPSESTRWSHEVFETPAGTARAENVLVDRLAFNQLSEAHIDLAAQFRSADALNRLAFLCAEAFREDDVDLAWRGIRIAVQDPYGDDRKRSSFLDLKIRRAAVGLVDSSQPSA